MAKAPNPTTASTSSNPEQASNTITYRPSSLPQNPIQTQSMGFVMSLLHPLPRYRNMTLHLVPPGTRTAVLDDHKWAAWHTTTLLIQSKTLLPWARVSIRQGTIPKKSWEMQALANVFTSNCAVFLNSDATLPYSPVDLADMESHLALDVAPNDTLLISHPKRESSSMLTNIIVSMNCPIAYSLFASCQGVTTTVELPTKHFHQGELVQDTADIQISPAPRSILGSAYYDFFDGCTLAPNLKTMHKKKTGDCWELTGDRKTRYQWAIWATHPDNLPHLTAFATQHAPGKRKGSTSQQPPARRSRPAGASATFAQEGAQATPAPVQGTPAHTAGETTSQETSPQPNEGTDTDMSDNPDPAHAASPEEELEMDDVLPHDFDASQLPLDITPAIFLEQYTQLGFKPETALPSGVTMDFIISPIRLAQAEGLTLPPSFSPEDCLDVPLPDFIALLNTINWQEPGPSSLPTA